MAFARKFRKVLAVMFFLVWTHVDLCIAGSALKSMPYSWQVKASDTSVATEGVEYLFDRNISTSYAPSETVLVDVNLENLQSVSEIRIYTKSQLELSFFRIAAKKQKHPPTPIKWGFGGIPPLRGVGGCS